MPGNGRSGGCRTGFFAKALANPPPVGYNRFRNNQKREPISKREGRIKNKRKTATAVCRGTSPDLPEPGGDRMLTPEENRILTYESLSPAAEKALAEQLRRGRSEAAFPDEKAVRRRTDRDAASLLRPPFIRDCDKILHCPYYNRYTDKTQVFSFYRNDDISRRALHVQLVSRIARTVGRALGLNLDLIEAIALGHDIGHTPFGHAGERYLDELLFARTGRHFLHNLHSVRVLDGIFPFNITLQVLDGIAFHDGELELDRYEPGSVGSFEEFDRLREAAARDPAGSRKTLPATLEGCVVRLSDIIAYLGKDRQDAARARLIGGRYENGAIGTVNAEIIHNLETNLIENSLGKPYLCLDGEHFAALKKAKEENYREIYTREDVREQTDSVIRPMMAMLYERLRADLVGENRCSPIFTHHIRYVTDIHYERTVPYEASDPDQIVTDYIAGMTDDYFVDLFRYLFPDSPLRIRYHGYFDEE